MSNKQKLRDIINKAVPELMELEFGCKVIKSEMHEGIVVGEAYEQIAYLNYDKMQVFLAPADQFEILGKPPTLENLLLAIRKKHTKGCYYLRDDGTLFKWSKFASGGSGNHTVESTYITLDLTLPPLEQSEETIINLLKILE